MNKKKVIGITMGDPNGIGPEVIVKALKELVTSGDLFFDAVIYGSEQIISEASVLVDHYFSGEVVSAGDFGMNDLTPGRISGKAGRASIQCIETAVRDAINGKIDALVTAPISKESIHRAGSVYPGHTELLKDLTGAEHVVMMFDGGPFRVALVTIHTALREVPDMIKKNELLKTIRTCNKELTEKFGIKYPCIAVCGLNPHAGESGAFGREELEEIIPAVEDACREEMNVAGPFPADTLFYKALKGEWDIVIAMYHDQGLIPFKMMAFDTGVNITLGLPIIRTSPDHGTAYDIAWQGKANPNSMIQAIRIATELSENIK